MREILFRGKRENTGEWEYGNFVKSTFIGTYIVRKGICENFVDVIPETVGQYTGLTDKNGKKIFEGDIIDTPDRLVKVVWLEGNAQFDLEFIKFAHDIRIDNFRGIEMRDLVDYEVIGNIYDNPELLESGATE